MSEATPEIKNLWHIVVAQPDSVFELRAIWPKGGACERQPKSKLFRADDYQSLEARKEAVEASALALNGDGYNVYIVMNPIRSCFEGGRSVTDNDIDRRSVLLVDIDRSGVHDEPATDSEVQSARDLADEVVRYLHPRGFTTPVRVDSGNGHHLYFPLENVGNTPESTKSIRMLLHRLADRFDNDVVKIDTSVYNASRITKVVGTVARKGAEGPARPYRVAKLYTERDE